MRVTSIKNVNNYSLNSDFWSAHYYSGTVDRGSSGSALMNGNGQIIGQLRSGWSSCNYTDWGDRYGKFSRSWNAGGLQNWLSPTQNLQTTGLLNLTDISILGAPQISCTTPTTYSTLGGLEGVTYLWSVNGLQIISGQGTPNVVVSGLSGNTFGQGRLTWSLRTPAKGRTRVLVITKDINIFTGGNGSITGTYNSSTSSTAPLIPPTNRFDLTTYNESCIAFFTNINVPNGSTVTWQVSTISNGASWNQSSNNLFCSFTAVGQTAEFSVSITNSCGTSTSRYRFRCTSTNSCGISPARIGLAPNPTSNFMQISLFGNIEKTILKDISEIRVIDKLGNIKQQVKYGTGIKNVNLNTSLLNNDVYTILVFDGQNWTSEKFIKN
jgi:hypothetical protein